MGESAGVVVLFGPKAAGKSTIATLLEKHGGVHHVDPDAVVLALQASGRRPDADTGWLGAVEEVVREALVDHRWVAVEATGAWESDWALVDRLREDGPRVVRVWVTAPLQTTLTRLAERRPPRVGCSEQEARRIYEAATLRAASERFDAVVDTATEEARAAARGLMSLLGAPPRP